MASDLAHGRPGAFDEDAAGGGPRERDLPGIERIAGEELRVLLAEAGARASDRRRAGNGRAPRAPVERIVGAARASERHRELAEPHQAGHRRVELPRPGLHRPAGGREPYPSARVREDERCAVRTARIERRWRCAVS